MGKVQVCKLAKELNVPSKDLLGALNAMGEDVKTHLAWVDDAVAEAAKKRLNLPGASAPAPQAEAPRPMARPMPAPGAQPAARRMESPGNTPPMARPMPTQQARPMPGPQQARPVTGMQARPMPGPQQARPMQSGPQARPMPGMQARPVPGPQARPMPGPQQARPMPGPQSRPMPGAPMRPSQGMQARPVPGPHSPRPAGAPQRPMAPGGASPERRPERRPDRPAASAHTAGRNAPVRKLDREGDQQSAVKKPRRKSRAEHREDRRNRRKDQETAAAPTFIELIGALTVKELADKMAVKETEVIKRLFLKGIMATINQTIEKETAEMIAVEMGYEVNLIDPIAEALARVTEETDLPEDLKPRPPIVTVMGHVDHGKTSLLDAIRQTRVASGEAGGITQHIGAYMASINGNEICFLDTPGHEAFTAMRARGAKATDVAILVVAADDGVMPQTIEAISHAKAANVPIIVAINKIDKAGANAERVKQELTEYELVPEEWGGQTVMVEVSAKQRINLDTLLEMILLVTEVQELKANPDKAARGMIIEAKLSKGMGPVATVLVQNGTLRVGDPFVVGSISGRVRALINDLGKRVKEAGPAHPVEVLGLPDVPHAGDMFQVVESEKVARVIADQRANAEREQKMARNRVTLTTFFSRIQEGQKELPIIIKADVKGSSEAIEQALSQLNERTQGVTLRVLLSGNGDVSETDVNLAAASDALVIAFNVKTDDRAARAADDEKVDIRTYSIIYKMVEDLEKAMEGLLEPEYETVKIGQAEVRAIFKVGKSGVIAGAMVTEGKLQRNCTIKVSRGKDIVYEGKLDSLKRFKDDVKDVATGYECGISLDKYNAFEEGDIVEAYLTQEKKR